MAPPAAYFVVLVCIGCAVTAADQQQGPDKSTRSSGHMMVLELPGHPAAYCGYYSHLEPALGGASLFFTLLLLGDKDRDVRDGYNCTLAGDEHDFNRLVEDSMLTVRETNGTDPWPVLETGPVSCELQPLGPGGAANSAVADVFDFRVTRVSSKLPPFLCLWVDATRTPAAPLDESVAPPENGALVFRFIGDDAPDLVCRPFTDIPMGPSDGEVEVYGFVHPDSGPLNCSFRGRPDPRLESSVEQQVRAQLESRPDQTPKLTLPSAMCQHMSPADHVPQPADDKPAAPAYTVTGPSGRWILCQNVLEIMK